MIEDYTIEQLEKTFNEHSEKNIIQREKDIELWKRDHPYEEYPYEYFNISEALHVICKEINEIKKQRSLDIRYRSLNGLGNLPID